MIRKRMLMNRSIIIYLLVVILLYGCATTLKPGDYSINKTYSKKIPIHVGLVLTDKFRISKVPLVQGNYAAVGTTELGEAMTKGAEIVFREVFDEVTVLDNAYSITTVQKNIQVIANPEITMAVLNYEGVKYWHSTYQITCKWTIFQPDGKVLYMNEIRGEGYDDTYHGKTRFEKASALAIKDHYEKLMVDLMSTNWWKNIN